VTTGKGVLALGAMAAVLLSAGCARPTSSAAPPTVQPTTPAQNDPVASPTPSASPSAFASLTGAAGNPLWSRPGAYGDRAVAVGDAVAVVEGGAATPTATPTAAATATATATPSAGTAVSYRLIVLDAANGRERATHNLGDHSTGSVPLQAKTYRGDPVATSIGSGKPEVEVAYGAAGRKVWTAPHARAALFGDAGEYLLQLRTRTPQAGGSAVNYQRLLSLTGRGIVDVGPQETHKGDVVFVHDDAAVIAQSGNVRVDTVARSPRTLWSTGQAKPQGFGSAEPVAVFGDDLLVQWRNASQSRLALYDFQTGEQTWQSETLTGGVTRGAAVQDRTTGVAVLGSDGTGPTLGVEMRTGKVSWRLPSQRNFRPVAAWRGQVYGASGDTALAIDARTGRASTLGTHVEVAGVTTDGILALRGNTSQTTGTLWGIKLSRT
jgi:hypothetical protein